MSETASNSDRQSRHTYTEVTRRLPIPALKGRDGEKRVREALDNMEGVNDVRLQLEKQRVVLRYDATKLDIQRITNVLSSVGYPVASTLWARLKLAWYGFLDENIRDNAAAPPKPCCHNADRLFASRRKR